MGCDIHVAVQWLEYPANDRVPEDRWSTLGEEMHWGRDYALFTRLAGVRCNCECDVHQYGDGKCPQAASAPRGWPTDKFFGLYEMKDNGDLHTPSWLTLEETKKAAGDGCDAEVYATIAAMEEFERRGYKTRLVFAFDN